MDKHYMVEWVGVSVVEAEHAAALADLVSPGSDLFAPEAFQTARTPEQVLQIVAPFLAAGPTMPGMPNTGGGFAAGLGSSGSGLRQGSLEGLLPQARGRILRTAQNDKDNHCLIFVILSRAKNPSPGSITD